MQEEEKIPGICLIITGGMFLLNKLVNSYFYYEENNNYKMETLGLNPDQDASGLV